MNRTAFVRLTGLILAAGVALAGGLRAGALPGQGIPPSLREYFKGLVDNPGKSASGTPEDLSRLSKQLDKGSREEISEALPAILAAAGNKDTTVKGLGTLALFGISLRPDRYELLSKQLPLLTGLISSNDPRAVGLALMTLSNVWPHLPPEVFSRLLDYLKRQDADLSKQVGFMGYLVQGAADHQEVVPAVVEFWSRPMDNRTRIDAINALSNGHPKDPRLIDLLISSLDDHAFEVRSAAFARLTNTPAASQEAKLPMQRVAGEYVNLLRQKDADPNVQISAIHNLLYYAPDDPQVLNALVEFYSRPLDRGARRVALDALRSTRIKDVRLIDFVIASLHDPYPEVRSNAAYVLKDMGSQALLRAEPALKVVAEDPAEPAEVKEAAGRALKEIPGVTH